jgi:hypothetical protein
MILGPKATLAQAERKCFRRTCQVSLVSQGKCWGDIADARGKTPGGPDLGVYVGEVPLNFTSPWRCRGLPKLG